MIKSISQKKQAPDDWFKLVIKNALHFLNSSIENLDKAPRSAIIDLHTAVELFFKARLMKEHWSLILSKPELANINNFEIGSFHSVYLDQAVKRLQDICSEKFKTEALENFKALSEHRNQIVHFAHTQFEDNRSTITVEHWASWFYLYDLLTVQWNVIFSEVQTEVENLNKRILKNKSFLKIKFDRIEPTIKSKTKEGNAFVICNSCDFSSGLVIKHNKWGHDYECLVCNVKDVSLTEIRTEIPCESCKVNFPYFVGKNALSCPHCQYENTLEYALLRYSEIYKSEDPDCRFEDNLSAVAYCHNCLIDTPTVIKLEDLWVCVNCRDRGWTALDCQNCESFVTGDVEKIKSFACHRCENEVSEKLLRELQEFELDLDREMDALDEMIDQTESQNEMTNNSES
jgi:hypothetical protein